MNAPAPLLPTSRAPTGRLPTGRPGQALAVLLLLLALALVWTAAISPLLDWHAERTETIDGRRTLARRMAQLAATLPELQRRAAQTSATPGTQSAVPVLEGATDAVAGATLQQRVQAMAAQAGAPLSSAEILPAEPVGAYRRVALRIAVRAPWPVLVQFLQAIAEAQPGMTVEDLQLHGTRGFIRDAAAALDATWTILAFRPGTAAPTAQPTVPPAAPAAASTK